MSSDTVMTGWVVLGLASHVFWWGMLTSFKDGTAIVCCLLSALPAALFGPISFPFEGFLYWLTGPHQSEEGE